MINIFSKLNQQGKEEIDSQILYASSEELMDKRKILDPFNHSYSQEFENVAQDSQIEKVSNVELLLTMPIMEECINNYIFQILVDYTTMQTLNPDLHEETLKHEISDLEDDRPTVVIHLEKNPKREQPFITNDVHVSPLADPQEVMFHDFHNPLESLLEALEKVEFPSL